MAPSQLSYQSLIQLYIAVSIYRLLNAYFIQTQFDPDEFWQTLEPAYCLAFSNPKSSSCNNNCVYTWEWTRSLSDDSSASSSSSSSSSFGLLHNVLHGPVRSHLAILPTFWFYKFVQYMSIDTSTTLSSYVISHGPLFCNALLVTAPTDVAIYCIARWIQHDHDQNHNNNNTNNHIINNINESRNRNSIINDNIPTLAIIASVTNWFHGYALIRTYGNSLETMLLTIGIALLAPDLFSGKKNNGVNITNEKEEADSVVKITRNSKIAFLLGGLSVAIRFTSLAAWVPIGLILCFGKENKATNKFKYGIHYVFHLCALYGGMGLILGCIVDWYFYGYKLVVPFLGNFHFNVLIGNGSLYGTHPCYWYFVAGLPAIAGVLLPFFLYESYIILIGREKSQNSSQITWTPKPTLFTIILSYVAFHSISSHKEFRFILPILPLVCILSSCSMQRYIRTKDNNTTHKGRLFHIVMLLFILNYPHLIFLGMFHQRSPISVNKAITSHIQTLNSRNAKNGTTTTTVDTSENQRMYSIHFLMGCHSTPLYSHLHVPNTRTTFGITQIDAWTLDCSPQCRNDSASSCESDAFTSNPYKFMIASYDFGGSVSGSISSSSIEYGLDVANSLHEAVANNVGGVTISQPLRVEKDPESSELNIRRDEISDNQFANAFCINDNDQSCQIRSIRGKKVRPDFLAMFDGELEKEHVRNLIENEMGMIEIGKFIHGISEVDWKNFTISYHYMYLFGKKEDFL